MILQRLAPLTHDTIQGCLEADSTKWETLSVQCSNMQETTYALMSMEQVTNFYNKAIEGIINPVALADMIELSKVLS